ncbi:hypothetical protein KEM56_006563 [Ascosphaera pollenicola]|nr:hypothetical protein KEM56_006563 [Ascosphaera pollenicola]
MGFSNGAAQRQSIELLTIAPHPQPPASSTRTSSSAEQLSTGAQTDTGDSMEEEPFRATKTVLLAGLAIFLIILAAAIDATSLSIALPIVTERLKGTAIQAFWAGTSYLVTSGVMQPVIGGLSHVFGRKEMVLISCALVGRVIQGIGGGGILALGEILITDLVPLEVRGVWLGMFGFAWAIGTVTGPLMGGAFAEAGHSGWRWIFWINLPMIGLGTIATICFLRIKRLPGSIYEKAQQFDWFGSVLFVASSVSFLVPVSWGGILYEWNSWHTLVPLLLGAAGMVASFFYERWLTMRALDEEGNFISQSRLIKPIIPFTIFSNRTLNLLFLYTMVHGCLLWSLMYFLPLYYEGVKGYRPVVSGVAVLPETFLIAPMSIIAGYAVSKTGRYRWAIWIGWAITILGFGILYLLDAGTSIPAFIFINVPVAIGTGLSFTSMSLAVQASGRPQDAGHSITFYSFIRVFGQSIGVAISGAIFQNQLRKKLSAYPLLSSQAKQFSQDATELVSIIKAMPPGLARDQLVDAFADALKVIWVVMTAFAAAVFFTTFLLKDYSLKQQHTTRQGIDEGSDKEELEKGSTDRLT